MDADDLANQFQDHVRLAQTAKARKPKLSAASAWDCALRETAKRAAKNGKHSASNIWPQIALRSVVQRLLVATGSTSSIEQMFSERQLMLQEEVRHNGTPDESLITDARRVWAMHLRMARKAGSTRLLFLGTRASRRILLQKRKAAIDSLSKANTAKEWLTQCSSWSLLR